jgi:hypothetical protein
MSLCRKYYAISLLTLLGFMLSMGASPHAALTEGPTQPLPSMPSFFLTIEVDHNQGIVHTHMQGAPSGATGFLAFNVHHIGPFGSPTVSDVLLPVQFDAAGVANMTMTLNSIAAGIDQFAATVYGITSIDSATHLTTENSVGFQSRLVADFEHLQQIDPAASEYLLQLVNTGVAPTQSIDSSHAFLSQIIGLGGQPLLSGSGHVFSASCASPVLGGPAGLFGGN